MHEGGVHHVFLLLQHALYFIFLRHSIILQLSRASENRERGINNKHPFSTKINYFCTEYSTVLTPTAEGPIDYSGKGSRVLPEHRRRIELEDKAKVVASVWGTAFVQFLAAL